MSRLYNMYLSNLFVTQRCYQCLECTYSNMTFKADVIAAHDNRASKSICNKYEITDKGSKRDALIIARFGNNWYLLGHSASTARRHRNGCPRRTAGNTHALTSDHVHRKGCCPHAIWLQSGCRCPLVRFLCVQISEVKLCSIPEIEYVNKLQLSWGCVTATLKFTRRKIICYFTAYIVILELTIDYP